MIDLYKLRHFYTLARVGSYVRASAELQISQSALSRSIQTIERGYGVVLLERGWGRRGIRLTPAGERLLRRVPELLRQAEEVEAALRGQAAPRERLAFGMGPLAAGLFVPEALREVLAMSRYPCIQVVIRSPATMAELLLAGKLDLYIGQEDRPTGRISKELLGVAHTRLWARHGHPLSRRRDEPYRLEDVAAFPIMAGESWNSHVLPLIEEQAPRQRLEADVQIDNLDVLLKLARGSDAILLSHVVPANCGLAELPIALQLPPSPLHSFSLRGVEPTQLAEQVLGELRALFVVSVDPAAHVRPEGRE